MRLNRLTIPLLCILLIAGSSVLAQDATPTTDDRIRFFAPSSSGQTGLFETVTADTLRRGTWSFGVYFNDYDLLAGEARDLAPPSARDYDDLSYDLYRLSASIGVGLTDRWEVSAMLPWDRIVSNGGDRVGFINGNLYRGQFTESGLGNARLATKFLLTPVDAPSRFAVSAFVGLPTGDDDISGGGTDFGLGGHWTGGRASAALTYVARGGGGDDDDLTGFGDLEVPNEIRLDAGLNWPIGMFGGSTNWISELNTVFYTGGDRAPDSPLFLVTGVRHWFGDSGWALNAGARWNAAKFFDGNDECRFTELDDCALSGLVGLTFAPLALTVAPPPPAPVPVPTPPPPVETAPVPPPAPPVAPPRQPQEIRTDEIHFEPGSARLTNIAKAILDEVALRMKQEPSATALVIGYTDDRENTGPNRDLDRRRAEAVRDYLVSRHGIDPARITVEGRGTSDPVGDNSTAEGRLRNRRVVIRLILP